MDITAGKEKKIKRGVLHTIKGPNLLSLLSVSNGASHLLAQSCPGTKVLFLYIAIAKDYTLL